MTSVVYDNIWGSTTESNYYKAGAESTSLYPDSNNISIFGPLWLPRVYGKDLTNFEIASSGKISITINDVHALDFSKTGRVTKLQAKSNDSFEINVSSNQMYFNFDATTNDITLVSDQGGSTRLYSSNEIVFLASNNVKLTASNNFLAQASNDVSIKANKGSFYLNAGSSNMTLTMHSNDNTTYWYSSNDINITTSNDYWLYAKSNIGMFAATGRVDIVGQGSNTRMSFNDGTDNIFLYSSNDTQISTSNDFILRTNSNASLGVIGTGLMSFYTNSSNIHLILNGDDAKTTWYSSNDFTFSTCNDVIVNAHDSNVTFRMGDSNMDLYAISNINIEASNDYNLTAYDDIVVNSVNGSTSFFVHNSNVFFVMSNNDNMTGYASNGIQFYTSNSFVAEATSNFNFNAKNGDFATYAESNIYLSADQSNMTMTMDRNGDVITLYTLSNIVMTASNSFELTTRSNVFITTSNAYIVSQSNVSIQTSNDLVLSASNNLYLNVSKDLLINGSNLSFDIVGNTDFYANSNINFYIDRSSNPTDATVMFSQDRVNIRGDLWITGSINTNNIINTTVVQETLKVNDKTILLASSNDEGGVPDEGELNDGSGIIVDGMPNGSDNLELYKKSLLWKWNTGGTPHLGTTNLTTEAAWEFRGGGIRINHRKDIGSGVIKDLWFTFRVNELDELELVKKYWSTTTGDYVWKKIAKFGRILSA
jgi:uncharacterized protein (DUF2345 family)